VISSDLGFLNKQISRKMHEKYVIINKVPTHIMSWGKSLDDEWQEPENGQKKEAIVVITGNPGTFLFSK
jgi:hypothetical protein